MVKELGCLMVDNGYILSLIPLIMDQMFRE